MHAFLKKKMKMLSIKRELKSFIIPSKDDSGSVVNILVYFLPVIFFANVCLYYSLHYIIYTALKPTFSHISSHYCECPSSLDIFQKRPFFMSE